MKARRISRNLLESLKVGSCGVYAYSPPMRAGLHALAANKSFVRMLQEPSSSHMDCHAHRDAGVRFGELGVHCGHFASRDGGLACGGRGKFLACSKRSFLCIFVIRSVSNEEHQFFLAILMYHSINHATGWKWFSRCIWLCRHLDWRCSVLYTGLCQFSWLSRRLVASMAFSLRPLDCSCRAPRSSSYLPSSRSSTWSAPRPCPRWSSQWVYL